ncbi:MAG: hypothetical protein ALAOOOJD_01539 [bacterium]|nr:hypothetical protein [bacterium]
MQKSIIHFSVLIILFFVSPASADDFLRPLRAAAPPLIDGKLDDAIWQHAPSVSGFKTYFPDYDKDMADSTVAYYAYDHENLYFAFRCFDREPDKIKASVTRRDNIRPDDWICINLDSFNDQQSLYGFYVNPAGIQSDTKFASGREDDGIDLIWYSAGKVDNQGYTIEIRIPFKSIRFANREPVEMGVVFERRISRRAEQGTFPPLKPQRGMFFLTQMQPLQLHDIKHYQLFELLPAVTYSERSSRDAQNKLAADGQNKDLSLTAKYGLTSHFIFDGTYNPDFSQVEADAGQVDVNLRSALFFTEKRPFFQEGNEDFNFAGGSFEDPLGAVVHTRTIIDPVAGLKLSGKLGKKNILAAIDALDELPEENQQGKRAHVSIMRYKRALSDDSYIGAYYTGRELKHGFNRVGGPDGQFRINESSIIGYHFFMADNKDSVNATKERGHALGMDYLYNTRNLDVNIGVHDLSTDFNTTTGFLTRNGLTRMRVTFTPKFYPKQGWVRRLDPIFFSAQTKDKPSGQYETDNALLLRFYLRRNANISLRANYSTEIFLGEKFKTRGWNLSGSSQLTKEFTFQLSYRQGKKIRYVASPYQGQGHDAAANIIYQPSDKLNATFNLTYSDLFRESNSEKIFAVTILRGRLTYQLNRYLFIRTIAEHNDFRKRLLTDFLASFTYIPGTVLHFGYGSLYEKNVLPNDDGFTETRRGLFAKASYLWRL